ncbi:unnamed protein product [Rhizophagus irregularis]|nr:unnamed protein product [Rhizophagus irregularis]
MFTYKGTNVKEIIHELELRREVDLNKKIIKFFGITDKENLIDQTKKCLLVMEWIVHCNLHPGSYRETIVPNTPLDYSILYTECWDNEPDNRPTMDQVVAKLKEIITKNKTITQKPKLNFDYGSK